MDSTVAIYMVQMTLKRHQFFREKIYIYIYITSGEPESTELSIPEAELAYCNLSLSKQSETETNGMTTITWVRHINGVHYYGIVGLIPICLQIH